MILTLLRQPIPGTDLLHGMLCTHSHKCCDTLESASKALPAGEYEVHILTCQCHQRKALILTDGSFDIGRHLQQCNDCSLLRKRILGMREEVRSNLMEAIQQNLSADAIQALEGTLEERLQTHIGIMREVAPGAQIRCRRFAIGNSIGRHHDGSILVGTLVPTNILLRSTPDYDRLFNSIRTALIRGLPVTVKVEDLRPQT